LSAEGAIHLVVQRQSRVRSFLIPNILFIELQVIPHQKPPVFFLKCLFAMVLLLVINVAYQLLQLTPTYGEISVATLPKKGLVLLTLVLNPGGRGPFDFLQELCLADSASESCGDVDVIGRATDTVGCAIAITTKSGQISMHARPNYVVEPGPPVFSTEHDMKDDLAEGLGHISVPLASRRSYEAGLWPAIEKTIA
jgi:hypothetical protein